MDDKMNRQLTCPVSQADTSMLLAQELVHFGFINEVSIEIISYAYMRKLEILTHVLPRNEIGIWFINNGTIL